LIKKIFLTLLLTVFAVSLFAVPANSVIQAHQWSDKYGGIIMETGLAPDGDSIGYIGAGDWVRYNGVDFDAGQFDVFMATVAVDPTADGETFEIRLDSTTGTLIGTFTVASTGGWTVFEEQYADISSVTGVHDLFLVFPNSPVANINWFIFSVDTQNETEQERDQRMAWWREARFGQFIHWGAYSELGGYYQGQDGGTYAEWIMINLGISVSNYQTDAAIPFNPVDFDAAEWVTAAKNAGQKYIVITSKHHEGFSMYDTGVTDFDPYDIKDYGSYNSDPIAALAQEAQTQGVKFCVYYSIMDWRHPKQSNWGNSISDKPGYVSQMKEQLRELIEYYDVELLWFDGEWKSWWTTQDGVELYRYLRTLKPSLIINNRVGKRAQTDGDYGTPEQEIPATGLDYDWESCMTLNNTWGYKSTDFNWKSRTTVLQNLVDIASKGGNYLLNVGPDGEGVIPQASIDRLAEIGTWLDTYGDSIYATNASPFDFLEWGRCTQKTGKLYLQVFNWPSNNELVVPGLLNDITRIYLLNDPVPDLSYQRSGNDVNITVPTTAPDVDVSVVVMEIVGAPNVVHAWDGPRSIPGKIEAENYRNGGEGVGYHDTTAGNTTGLYRDDDVDIEDKEGTGMLNIGYVAVDEWLAYDADIATTANYTLTARVASIFSGMNFHIEVDSVDVSGPISIPNTGDWGIFSTTQKNFTLTAGSSSEMKVIFDDGNVNIDWIDFAENGTPGPTPTPTPTPPPLSQTVNDTDASIVYTGTWNYAPNRTFTTDYNLDVHWTTTNSDYVEYTFTGTAIAYVTEKNNDQGDVDVYIDDVYETTVSCYNATRLAQVDVFTKTGLSPGSHTIKLVKVNGQYMLLDAFKK
jgi:alpha-L-fucosidase